MIYLAVDPGKATGWAHWSARRGFYSGEMEFMAFLDWSWECLDRYDGWRDDMTIVVERFTITDGTVRKTRGDTHWSLETIGVLRWMAQKHGHTFELQSLSDAGKFCDNARLRQVGWWFSGGDGHANDAARHLLLAIARHEPQALQDLLIV